MAFHTYWIDDIWKAIVHKVHKNLGWQRVCGAVSAATLLAQRVAASLIYPTNTCILILNALPAAALIQGNRRTSKLVPIMSMRVPLKQNIKYDNVLLKGAGFHSH